MAAQDAQRLNSKQSVHARSIGGRTVAARVREVLKEAGVCALACVVGDRQEQVRAALGEDMAYVLQEERLGTGHAARQAASFLESRDGLTLVVPGDAPLLTTATVKRALATFSAESLDCLLLVARAGEPAGIHLLTPEAADEVVAVRRSAAGTERELEVSSGFYVFRTAMLLSVLGRMRFAADGRLDLAACLPILVADGRRVATLGMPPAEARHVRTVGDLVFAERILSQREAQRLLDAGVELQRPETSIIEAGVEVAADTRIAPDVTLLGDTEIGPGCHIERGVVLENARIGAGCHIGPHTVIRFSELGKDCDIGPAVCLRDGAWIDRKTRIAAGAEIANAVIGRRVVIEAHVSLVDCDVGSDSRIGAGTVTANYDTGGQSQRTSIGQMVVVGSNTTLVAPLEIGDNAVIAAGSVITEPVGSFALAIARQRQSTMDDWVRRQRMRRGG
ncbi:MAG: NTP transferase domain-containing protein [Bacillota bacterium]|nr:NTP transferase domain-containing protein [Bacillota bacterium]